MKKLILILTIGILAFLTSCTDNARAKSWGGDVTIELPPGKKLISAYFVGKGDPSLWYLTEDMDPDYVPQIKVMQEYSHFGILEGTVTFKETR